MTSEQDWNRLDRRTLLTHPLSTLRSFALPIVVSAIGLASSGSWFGLMIMLPISLAIAAAVGVLPWLTTRYRITPSHIEVKTGLLNTKTLTARIDRVRSVDFEAPLLQRALGITRVQIGTGVDEGQITLDALALTTATAVRRQLLHRDSIPAATDLPSPDPGADSIAASGQVPARVPGQVPAQDLKHSATPPPPGPPTHPIHPNHPTPLARLDWSWLRFAPLNLVNLAVVAGSTIALATQATDVLGPVRDLARSAEGSDTRLAVVIPMVALAGVGFWIIGSCLGYALRWFGLALTRDQGKDGPVLHQTAGLFTTRSTTVDETKVRGARIRQQVLIAAAGGAELSALTIGMKDNTPALLPTAPVADVRRVVSDLLNDPLPATVALTKHGRRPLARYLRRAAAGTIPAIALAVAGALVDTPLWAGVTLIALSWAGLTILAVIRWRKLGHALTGSHLVAQSGALVCDRTILELDGIVGWSIRQTVFDRRLGLARLTATTAAGDERVIVHDVPIEEAVRIAARATPRLVEPFLSPAR